MHIKIKSDNCMAISDPSSESSVSSNKHGYFYSENKTRHAEHMVKDEGSLGLDIDQGQRRMSGMPGDVQYIKDGQKTKEKLPIEGSQAHFKI